jgi:hypothetical protein
VNLRNTYHRAECLQGKSYSHWRSCVSLRYSGERRYKRIQEGWLPATPQTLAGGEENADMAGGDAPWGGSSCHQAKDVPLFSREEDISNCRKMTLFLAGKTQKRSASGDPAEEARKRACRLRKML